MTPKQLIHTGLASLKRAGVRTTIRKIFVYFSAPEREMRRRYKAMLKMQDPKEKFREIYRHRLWGGGNESASGGGSTLEYTRNLRHSLPAIFEKYNVKRILDVPCGDFNWMKAVLLEHPEIEYIGGDIVSEMIEDNRILYGRENVTFELIDVTETRFPHADLMIVRDCLFHLSNEDVLKFIENIKRTSIPYVLTTTHIFDTIHQNTDIETGSFRRIDIFAAPFNFPSPPLERIEDFMAPEPPREMCLFEVASLPSPERAKDALQQPGDKQRYYTPQMGAQIS